MADADNPKSDRPSATADLAAPSASFATANTNPSYVSEPTRSSSKSPPANHSRTEASAKQTPLESQPMTATTSTSSLLPDPPTKDATDPSAASPYGTRSRNKNGSSRPNYAEEPEIMDYEWANTKKHAAEIVHAAALATLDFDKPLGANTRRSSNSAAVPSTTMPRAAIGNTAAHQIPGMSSFSVYPEAAPAPIASTRKRKAPGGTPATQQSFPALTQTAASGPLRRQGPATNLQTMRTTTLMTFEGSQGYLKNAKLKADDGTWLAVGDQVYSICEPPGEPYYLARILEFLHADNDHTKPVTEIKVNWFLRPRDCSRKANDTRTVYATFQTATIDITTLRGKCTVLHRNEVGDLDLYRKTPNAFWYDKLFDRYIHRFYEVIPIAQVINVPAKVKKVLDERWKYVVVEIGRGKELTSAIKSCKRCSGYSASNDSVDCAVCKNTYHMACVRPPLLKKPARGFGWSCGPCSRKQERRLEARNTPNQAGEGEEEEFVDEEEDDHGANTQNGHQNNPNDPNSTESGNHPPTAEQLELSRLWPYRYLGLHCKLEDALDYDDRIYPRASSRLGPKHQANVHVWHGRPVRYVKTKETKRKYMKGNTYKRDARFGKETVAAVDADKADKEKRPKWVLDEPPGYIHRGEDHPNGDVKNTAQVMFRMPSVGEASSRGQDDDSSEVSPEERAKLVDDYMEKAKRLAPNFGLQDYSTNFLDKALELFTANDYQSEKALAQLQNVKKRKDLKEPDLTKEEVRRFEEAVSKYGSELRTISRHVGKPQKHGEIVRFYYMWKKTPNGQQIWGNFDGRKGKKAAKQADSKLLDDVADDADDSAFDSAKATVRKRGFICKFCSRRQSSQWRRAPATQPGTTVPADPSLKASKDKSAHLILALCDRCGSLWRRLGIQYEDVETVSKKIASSGGRAWKRRIDEELLAELVGVNVSSDISMNKTTADAAAAIGVEIPANLMIQPGQEGSKKKLKTSIEPPISLEPPNGLALEPIKKKETEKPIEPPPMIPEEPRVRLLPCAVCYEGEPGGDQLLICRHCRLTVHRNCYGAPEAKSSEKWTCDMCLNDLVSTVSTVYTCSLCTVEANTDTDVALLMEPPRVSHKKKTDREREKERLEKEMIDQRAELYFIEQERRGRAKTPRQPLKRTSGNNWVHIICAIFHPEIKFSDSKLLEFAEGFAAIPSSKWTSKCKQCKKLEGACVNCAHCQAPVHATCAQQYGFSLLFDLSPVKQSRKDAISTVDMGGEIGNATAAIYCREHGPKHTTHRLNEIDADSPLNALQKYARSHKQADISQTGTQRKAVMVQTATRNATQTAESGGTRSAAAAAASAVNGNTTASSAGRSSHVSPSTVTIQSEEVDEDGDRVVRLSEVPAIDSSAVKACSKCGTRASPKFYLIKAKAEHQIFESSALRPPESFSNGLLNGNHANLNEQSKAEKEDVAMAGISDGGPQWLCHKCKLRKLKNPTPPLRVPTPPPEPTAVEATATESTAVEPNEPEPASPQVHVLWPSQASVPVPPPPPELHRRYSNGPTEPPYYGPDHVPNGVHHSPVVAPPPLPPPPPPPPASHYGPPPPPPQPVYGPPPYAYRADSRDRSHSYPRNPGLPPPAHYHGPPAHGAPYEPPSFQYRRDRSGTLIQVPYIPPASRGQPPPPNPPLRSPQSAHRLTRSPHLRSPQAPTLPPPTHPHMTPPLRRARSPVIPDQGPHGPPEADSNPFAVPHGSHTSPRQSYQNGSIYDSPHSGHARPETPDYAREGRWPSQHRDHGERPTTNGASESPHLRNLLH